MLVVLDGKEQSALGPASLCFSRNMREVGISRSRGFSNETAANAVSLAPDGRRATFAFWQRRPQGQRHIAISFWRCAARGRRDWPTLAERCCDRSGTSSSKSGALAAFSRMVAGIEHRAVRYLQSWDYGGLGTVCRQSVISSASA